jgi:DNA polymerase III delta subunit
VVLLDGEDIKELELISLLEDTPMDGPRTFILDNAQKMKTTKHFKAFIDARASSSGVILFAVVRNEKLPEIWSYVSQLPGKCTPARAHQKFKPWEIDKVIDWINEQASRYNKTMSKDAAKALIAAVSIDLYRLSNEVRKLALLVGSEPVIANDQLALIVSRSRTATQFDVAEATISKNTKWAMNAFSILYRNDGEESFVPMVGALMKQVERTFVARNMLDRGVPEDELAASVGLRPGTIPLRKLLEQARKHTPKYLSRHMSRLSKLDVHVKGSARSKRTLMELAILAIAR